MTRSPESLSVADTEVPFAPAEVKTLQVQA